MKRIRKLISVLMIFAFSSVKVFADIAPIPPYEYDQNTVSQTGEAALTNSQPQSILMLGIIVVISAILTSILVRKRK